MSIKQLANTPCGRATIEANDLQGLLRQVDREGLAGDVEDPQSTTGKVVDGAYEFYINSLLSAPSTQVVNAVSNMVPVGTRVLETLAAASISKLKSKLWKGGEEGRVTFLEAQAEAQGIGEGFKEAWEFLGLRFGKAGLMGTTEESLAKMNIPEELAKQSKIERKSRAIKGNDSGSIAAKGMDWLGNFVNIPGGALSRMDEVYKIINYRAEVSKRAMRETIKEMDTTGASLSRTQIQERFRAIKTASLDDTTSDAAIQGVADADRRTFTNQPQGAINKAMATGGHTIPGMRWVVPFRRTMVNLISYGAGMTPVPLMNPGSQTWKALREGGGAADEALGRMAAGSMLISGLYYTLGDTLDGEAPANLQARDLWEKDGHEPDSMLVAGKRLRLDYLGPLAQSMKIFARVQTAMSNIDEENDTDGRSHLELLARETLFHTADLLLDEHWMSSMAQLFTALTASSREGNLRPMEVYISKFAIGFIPNVAKQKLTRGLDPNIKDVDSTWNAFKAKIPGLSTSVANKISIWGEPIRYDHFLDPTYEEASTGQDAVSVEMRSIGLEFPERRRTMRAGDTTIRMSPEEFMQLQIWSGQGIQGAQPLRDVVKSRIRSKAYKKMTDLGKAEYLKDAMNHYADRAKQQLLSSPDFTLGQRVKEAKIDYRNRLRGNQ